MRRLPYQRTPESARGVNAYPDFKLKDQAGTEYELKGLLKDGPVALVFYRSASW